MLISCTIWFSAKHVSIAANVVAIHQCWGVMSNATNLKVKRIILQTLQKQLTLIEVGFYVWPSWVVRKDRFQNGAANCKRFTFYGIFGIVFSCSAVFKILYSVGSSGAWRNVTLLYFSIIFYCAGNITEVWVEAINKNWSVYILCYDTNVN